MKEALKCLLLLSGLLAFNAFSTPLQQAAGSSISSQPSIQGNSFQTDVTFLPVEKAFNVSAYVEQDTLIFDWFIEKNYYLYRDRFKIESPSSLIQFGELEFETGITKWDDFFETDMEVYYQQTLLKVPFKSDTETFQFKLESQGCADAGLCYPPHTRWFEINTTSGLVSSISAPLNQSNSGPLEPVTNTSLWLVLLLALIGGLILNLMPCVFPVLSIKVLSFTRTHQTSSEKQLHGLAYTLGIIASFLVIAALMLSLRSAGEAIGWGFQLQSPGFVIFLIYLFTVMGLSLSGYLQIGSGLMSLGQSADTGKGLNSSFMTGVLATTVASPCTAPFMGPALGFAISQPTYIALLVFAVLGLGMALPFLLLTMVPSLSDKLPKPGPWMENLKQFLAFPLFMTAIWLLWVAGRQTSVDVTAAIIIGLLLITMAIWLLRLDTVKKLWVKALSCALIIGALILPSWSLKLEHKDQQWEPYSEQRLNSLRLQSKPVFINLTADWCITCLVNERVAFGQSFYKSLEENGITYLKGDWTNNDPQVTKLLNKFNRSGVPLYLMYPNRDEAPEILPQILVETMLLEAISRANNRTK